MIYLNTFAGIPCLWLWLLGALGAFLLGWLLHWLLFGRTNKTLIDQLQSDNKTLEAAKLEMESEVGGLKYQIEEAKEETSKVKSDMYKIESDLMVMTGRYERLKRSLESGEITSKDTGSTGDVGTSASNTTDAVVSTGAPDGATSVLPYGKIFETDNLQIIEGVGPKIEGLLKNAGLTNWKEIADASLKDIQMVLDDAGPRYRIHDPKSWAEQARLAHEGKWEELVKYQKFLDGGSDKKGDFSSPSKVEKLGMKILGFSSNPEDLKIIEGIGPKIEQLLKNEGINTWAELSKTSVDRIQEILDKAGDRYRLADPGTWPKQAELAAAGKWSELSEYQDYLDGGVDPAKKK